jgi:hypothetical protein
MVAFATFHQCRKLHGIGFIVLVRVRIGEYHDAKIKKPPGFNGRLLLNLCFIKAKPFQLALKYYFFAFSVNFKAPL